MGKGSCAVMHNEAYLPSNVEKIYIAGYGQISADIYRKLRNSGLNMCSHLRESCEKNKEAEACRLGRSLYENVAR